MAEYSHAIVTCGLTKRFGYSYAIRDLSITIPSRSVLLIVGPNGAGKTTLLRLLATALRPSAGQATIFGRNLLTDAEKIRQFIAFVGTSHGMYAALTARENLAFVAAMSGHQNPEGDLLGRVGLDHVAGRLVRTFSQGMKRRLALARAWVQMPRLLLLDEPFSGLDAEGNQLVEALVSDVKTRDGNVVLATHEWERGLRLADVVVALAAGRQVEVLPAADISAPRLRVLAGGRL